MICRNDSRGYLIAFPPLSVMAMLTPALTTMALSQMMAGLAFTAVESTAYVAGFVILGLAAIWVLAKLIRIVPGS